MAPEELESLEETVEILSGAATMRRMVRAEAELAGGETESEAELEAVMDLRRPQGA